MLQCDVPRNSGLECLGGKKKIEENIFLLSHVWVAVQPPSMEHFTPAFTNPGISAGRVDIYKSLCQKPVSSWHVISWHPRGLMRLIGRAGCHLLGVFLLFSTSFSCVFPPCFVKAFPYRCERLGEPWAWHHAGEFSGRGLCGTGLVPYLYNGPHGETRIVQKCHEF